MEETGSSGTNPTLTVFLSLHRAVLRCQPLLLSLALPSWVRAAHLALDDAPVASGPLAIVHAVSHASATAQESELYFSLAIVYAVHYALNLVASFWI